MKDQQHRIPFRVWAEECPYDDGQWIARYSTPHGIRAITMRFPSIEAAKVAAAEAMCRELDQIAARADSRPPMTGRGCKTFIVSRNGRRSRPVLLAR